MPLSRINGVQLYWESHGHGDPLVFVHGSWGDHDNWAPVVPRLAEHFRVVTYDRRGHSRSERPTGQGSIHEDVADLAALVETLGLAPAYIVGNSGGSAVALGMAARRPDLFRALIAHEPALFALLEGDPASAPALAAIGERVGAVVEHLAAGRDEAGAELFVNTIAFGPGAWAQLPPQLRETFVRNAPTFLDETRDPDSLRIDVDALRRFDRPALLTTGEVSPPFFRTVVAKLADAIPHAAVRTIMGAGHVPHITHPEDYVRTLREFLAPPLSAGASV